MREGKIWKRETERGGREVEEGEREGEREGKRGGDKEKGNRWGEGGVWK